MTPNELLSAELAETIRLFEEAASTSAKIMDEENLDNLKMVQLLATVFGGYGRYDLVMVAVAFAMKSITEARAGTVTADDMIAGLNLNG